MICSVESVLKYPLVRVVSRDDDAGCYVICIGELRTEVEINIKSVSNDGDTSFSRSHTILTPLQAEPYLEKKPIADDRGYALHRAIEPLISYYDNAVRSGYTPEENWLLSLALV